MSLADLAKEIAKEGRFGDDMLVHMSRHEVAGLASLAPGGKLPTNPATGLPEAFFFLPFLFGAAPAAAAATGAAAAAAPALAATAAAPALASGMAAGLGAAMPSGLGALTAASAPTALTAAMPAAATAALPTAASALPAAATATLPQAAASGLASIAPEAAAAAAPAAAAPLAVNPVTATGAATTAPAVAAETAPLAVTGTAEGGLSAGAAGAGDALLGPAAAEQAGGGLFGGLGGGMDMSSMLQYAALGAMMMPQGSDKGGGEGRKDVSNRRYTDEEIEVSAPPSDYQPGIDPEWNYFPNYSMPYKAGGLVKGYATGGTVTTQGPTDGLAGGAPIWGFTGGRTGGASFPTSGYVPPTYVDTNPNPGPALPGGSQYGNLGYGFGRDKPAKYPNYYGTVRALGPTSPTEKAQLYSDKRNSRAAYRAGIAAFNRSFPQNFESSFDSAIESWWAQKQAEEEAAAQGNGMAAGGLTDLAGGAAPQGGGDDEMIIEAAVAAIQGQHPDPEAALQMFVEAFGEAALQDLVARVQQSGAPQGGDGMSDSVPAQMNGEPIALSQGEFVVPADVVSGLGNGSTDAGAQQLHGMMDRVRTMRNGGLTQPPAIDPKKAMPA